MARHFSLLLVLSLVLAACGTSQQDRGLSGAGIGAAGGAVVGAVTGLSVLQGALIGTGIGVAAGLLTDSEDVNLGEPIWKRFPGRGGATNVAAHDSLVANTQSALATLGYEPGPVDGVLGPRTSAAIREYQYDHELPIDGQPSATLERHILAQSR